MAICVKNIEFWLRVDRTLGFLLTLNIKVDSLVKCSPLQNKALHVDTMESSQRDRKKQNSYCQCQKVGVSQNLRKFRTVLGFS